jgi:uncharacterized protein
VGRLDHPRTGTTYEARFATSSWDRVRGLIGRPPEVLVIPGRGQVHTFGMRYPIDVVFCDSSWRVVRVIRGLPRRRVTRFVRGTRFVIEAPAGLIDDVIEGDTFDYVSSTDR